MLYAKCGILTAEEAEKKQKKNRGKKKERIKKKGRKRIIGARNQPWRMGDLRVDLSNYLE